jgi:hypothetical protein
MNAATADPGEFCGECFCELCVDCRGLLIVCRADLISAELLSRNSETYRLRVFAVTTRFISDHFTVETLDDAEDCGTTCSANSAISALIVATVNRFVVRLTDLADSAVVYLIAAAR